MHPHDVCFKCQLLPWRHESQDHEWVPHPGLVSKDRLRAKLAYETYQRKLQEAYPDELVGEPDLWENLDEGEHEAWLAVVRL